MSSFKRWLKNSVDPWPWIAKKVFRVDEIQAMITATDSRYLDARSWSAIRGVSEREARSQLEQGVQLGHLQECLLYEWADSPVRFVVPADYIGKKIRLADVGYFGEDDDTEVLISGDRTRRVFVASGEGWSHWRGVAR